jgi:hypothetical protein
VKKKNPIRKLSRKAAADCLLRAVGCWVQAAGGSALVAGNIGVMNDPGDIFGETTARFNFYVCIKVTGRRPQPEKIESERKA